MNRNIHSHMRVRQTHMYIVHTRIYSQGQFSGSQISLIDFASGQCNLIMFLKTAITIQIWPNYYSAVLLVASGNAVYLANMKLLLRVGLKFISGYITSIKLIESFVYKFCNPNWIDEITSTRIFNIPHLNIIKALLLIQLNYSGTKPLVL